ncbi:MAG: asparagine synthase-related protein, partial [Candidatus Methanomethyliaceae archaeon]
MPYLGAKKRLRRLLKEAILRGRPEGVLLSGGIDSSLLAVIAPRDMLRLGITASFKGSDAHDTIYSKIVSERLGIRHV